MSKMSQLIHREFQSDCRAQCFQAGGTHIMVYAWLYRDDPEFTSACEVSLDAAEHYRASRLQAPGSRPAFVQRRAFLRWLHRDQSWDASEPPGPGAQPRENPQALSVTSTAAMALAAVGPVCALGIDAEPADHDTDIHALAGGLFAQSECLDLGKAAAGDAHRLFYRLWRLKEARLKYRGQGLAKDLNGAVFTVLADGGLGVARRPTPGVTMRGAIPGFFECQFSGVDLALTVPAKPGGAGLWRVAKAIPVDPYESNAANNVRKPFAQGKSPAPGPIPPRDPARRPSPVRNHRTAW